MFRLDGDKATRALEHRAKWARKCVELTALPTVFILVLTFVSRWESLTAPDPQLLNSNPLLGVCLICTVYACIWLDWHLLRHRCCANCMRRYSPRGATLSRSPTPCSSHTSVLTRQGIASPDPQWGRL